MGNAGKNLTPVNARHLDQQGDFRSFNHTTTPTKESESLSDPLSYSANRAVSRLSHAEERILKKKTRWKSDISFRAEFR